METEEKELHDQRLLKSIPGACALTGFAVAVLGGLSVDNPTGVILTRSLVAMASCYAVGLLIALFAARAVRETVTAHAQRHPAPDVETVRRAAQGKGAETAADRNDNLAPPRAEAA